MVLTGADFGAQPLLDAVLVNVLKAACTPAWLDERVRACGLSHLTNPAKIPFVIVRVLQHQTTERGG